MSRQPAVIIALALALALPVALPLQAQTNKSTTTKKQSAASKKQSATKKQGTTKKRGTTKKQGTQPKTYSNKQIKGLESERSQVQSKIKAEQRKLDANQADVRRRLNELMLINSDIEKHSRSIAETEREIKDLDESIALLEQQLATLERQLDERKAKYIKSLRYMARHRNIQEDLMFIFSARSFTQMYRRMRFVREYAAYQRAQGEMVKAKQEQIAVKRDELARRKQAKNALLDRSMKAHDELQTKQTEQKRMVKTLRRQQQAIQNVIAEQKKRDAALNAQIDRLIAEEMEKARKAAAEEARKKAEAEAKRKADELARKKAAAEAAARENERRIAEAKAREAAAREAAKAAAKKSAEERAAAEQAAKAARAEREAAERKAKVDAERNKREVAKAKEAAKAEAALSHADRKLSTNFAGNRGRLPMPVTGSYKIVTHFGSYNVDGLKNVTLDNKGINIQASAGAKVRAIFDGEVSAVVSFGGSMIVMVRHGSYISVYCNLRTVGVSKGQKVATRQVLGSLGADNILQFQLRKETEKLNPELWLAK